MHLEKTRVQYRKGCDRNEVQGAVGAGEGAHGASQPVFIVCVCVCVFRGLGGEGRKGWLQLLTEDTTIYTGKFL